MSNNHDSHDILRQIKIYGMVASSLVIFTLVTVGASYLHITNDAATIAIALIISCIEATLVGGYMMHLFSEKKMIYGILLATAFFFVALMFLVFWSTQVGNRLHT